MDSSFCSKQLVGRCEIVGLVARSVPLGRSLWLFLSKMGYFRTSRVSWVLRKLSDVEEGCSVVEDDHGSPCGEVGYQGHELFGLDGAGIRGCRDLHGNTSATRCCGVNLEGSGCQGRLDPGGRVQISPAKGTVQRGKRQGRVSPTIHNKKVGADRGSFHRRFGHHAIESQPCEEETDEPNDQSDEEEEEFCLRLEEKMAASWIAQIGEEDLSETEAVDCFIAMNEQRKRTWAQALVLKKAARTDRGFFSSRTAVRNRVNGSRQLRQSMRRSPNPMDGDGTPKDLRARLRKENRCFRCKKSNTTRMGTAPPFFSGLTFLHIVGEESVWNAATWSGQCDGGCSMGDWIPGKSLRDT